MSWHSEIDVAILSVAAILFGTIWVVTNFYQYYPLIQSKILSFATRTSTEDAVFYNRSAPLSTLTECATFTADGDRTFPTIDVFVPAYKEGDVIHQAVKSIRESTYPKDSLNLHVLLEPDDTDTREAVDALSKQYALSTLIIPKDYPGDPNKPRALNFAFEHTSGDIVGVIDAENIVEPDLFDRIAAAIVDGDRDYVQGLVDMANESDGWLNLLFRAEYGFWYRLIVPAFRRLNFPIPLSGTTCFFRRETLEQASALRYLRTGAPWGEAPISDEHISDVKRHAPTPHTIPDGGYSAVSNEAAWLREHGLAGFIPWDPTNVTEDFELGLLLWAAEYDFGLVHSITREESPRTVSAWLKQRTRWQKGKLYTFFTFLRESVSSSAKQSHLLWQSFLPHLGPLNLLGFFTLVVVGILINYTPQYILIVGVLSMAAAFLLLGLLLYVLGYWFASTEPLARTVARALIVFVTAPLYWVLQWIADIRAITKIATGDLDWEKTVHPDAGRFNDLRHLEAQTDQNVRGLLKSYLTADLRVYPVLIVGLLLRFPGLRRSLWRDEAYTVVVRSSRSIIGVLLTQGPHPPLYFLLLKGWMTIFGTSEIAVRMLSLLFGVAAVVISYIFAAHLYDRLTGVVLAALMAVSTLQVQYAQTARMYSLMMCAALLSLYFYVRVLESPTLENRFGYGFSTLALLLSHVYGGFIILAQLLHLGTYVWRHRSRAYDRVKSVLLVNVAVGISILPWVVGILLPMLQSDSDAVTWFEAPDITVIRDIFYSYVGMPVNYPVISYSNFAQITGHILLIIFAVAFVYLAIRTIDHSWLVRLLKSTPLPVDSDEDIEPKANTPTIGRFHLAVVVLIATIVIPFIVSHILFPILTTASPRYAIAGFIGFGLILARGVSALPRRTVKVGALVILLLLATPGLMAYYQAPTAEDWEGLTATLNQEDVSNDLIVYNPEYTEDPVTYYMTNETKQKATEVNYTNGSNVQQKLETKQFDRIWVVKFTGASSDVDPIVRPEYTKVASHQYRDIELVEYERRQNESHSMDRESPGGDIDM